LAKSRLTVAALVDGVRDSGGGGVGGGKAGILDVGVVLKINKTYVDGSWGLPLLFAPGLPDGLFLIQKSKFWVNSGGS
jgi:hypothetical protein